METRKYQSQGHMDYTFNLPNLDRRTYSRLKELTQREGINQHGLVTLAINLLYETLSALNSETDGAYSVRLGLTRIQNETGIKRLTTPT